MPYRTRSCRHFKSGLIVLSVFEAADGNHINPVCPSVCIIAGSYKSHAECRRFHPGGVDMAVLRRMEFTIYSDRQKQCRIVVWMLCGIQYWTCLLIDTGCFGSYFRQIPTCWWHRQTKMNSVLHLMPAYTFCPTKNPAGFPKEVPTERWFVVHLPYGCDGIGEYFGLADTLRFYKALYMWYLPLWGLPIRYLKPQIRDSEVTCWTIRLCISDVCQWIQIWLNEGNSG